MKELVRLTADSSKPPRKFRRVSRLNFSGYYFQIYSDLQFTPTGCYFTVCTYGLLFLQFASSCYFANPFHEIQFNQTRNASD
ncbi:hypothetical protein MsAc7_07300 [Methanolapillus millepedarum]|uniref:Uncharacterized protein n=1 Tax=Methanolapillus millepedarum TaxID=3028296 RepID=A0AA96V2F2_9EURY|nr:hypothetical protein MsAc7_07300 [Methanosarcinaceae archaeon Ac7]